MKAAGCGLSAVRSSMRCRFCMVLPGKAEACHAAGETECGRLRAGGLPAPRMSGEERGACLAAPQGLQATSDALLPSCRCQSARFFSADAPAGLLRQGGIFSVFCRIHAVRKRVLSCDRGSGRPFPFEGPGEPVGFCGGRCHFVFCSVFFRFFALLR